MGNQLSAYSSADQVESALDLANSSVQYNGSGTFTKPQRYDKTTLSASGSFSPALSNLGFYDITLTGNLTIQNFIGLSSSDYVQDVYFILRQDGVGSRTLSFDTAYKFEDGIAPTLTVTPNAIDLVSGIVISPTEILCTTIKNWS